MSYSYTNEADKSDLLARIREEIELPSGTPVVRVGTRGNAAKRVQEHLCLSGFPVVIDGIFGGITEITVKTFQDHHNLTMDGIVGPVTYAKLVEPMTNTLKKIDPTGKSPAELVTLYARQHLANHPREIGGQNMGPWVRLYMKGHEGRPWAWCAGFVTFLMRQAYEHLDAAKPIEDTFSCDRLAESAKSAGIFRHANDVTPGNIPPGSIFLQRREPGDWVHTGVVTEAGFNYFSAIEGNTNDDGSREGYEVTQRRRSYTNRDFIVLDDPNAGQQDPIAIEEPNPEILNVAVLSNGIHQITPEIMVRRHFFDEATFETYGSFFTLWDGWATAAHVTEAADQKTPPFTVGDLLERPGPDMLDAALIGCTLPSVPPPQLTAQQRLQIFGFPAGSATVSIRQGRVHARRPEGMSWIVRIESPNEPVTSGMSGGAVVDVDTQQCVGIIIERNSKAELDLDPELDHSLNIVSLHEVWHAINGGGNV